MRASDIALTFVAGLAAATVASLVGTSAASILRDETIGLLVFLPAALGSAILVGRWVARRAAPPTAAELKAGCLLYVGLCALLALGAHQVIGWGGLLVAICIAAALHRSTTRILQDAAGQPTKPTRARV